MWRAARKDTSGMSKFQLQMSGQWNQQVLGKEMGASAGAAATISLDGQASTSLSSSLSSNEGNHLSFLFVLISYFPSQMFCMDQRITDPDTKRIFLLTIFR